MKTIKTSYLGLPILLLLIVPVAKTQVKIGDLNEPKTGALLDLNATTKGALLLPNVSLTDLGQIPAGLTGIGTAQPTNSELIGAIVYNTNPATGVGLYYWDGNNWIKSNNTPDVVDPPGLPPGSGRFSGRTTFDVAKTEATNCGPIADRTKVSVVYADFSQEATRKQTYTFEPSGSVRNVRFYYVESLQGKIVQQISGGCPGTVTGPATCEATVTYKDDLNATATGKTSADALKLDIYAVYNDGTENRAVKLTTRIQDCAFSGAYTISNTWLTFMPYNLGANPDYVTPEAQMAYNTPKGKNVTDSTVYGGLFQWGRPMDGHQRRNSATISEQSANPVPGHGKFILGSKNWYSGSDPDNLWTEATKTANDPFPPGYKVPSMAQWQSIFNGRGNFYYTDPGSKNNWSYKKTTGTVGIYSGGALFLPFAGFRIYTDGSISDWIGAYWSSSNFNQGNNHTMFSGSEAYGGRDDYAVGFSVRCVAE
jgi:hypothetical protein